MDLNELISTAKAPPARGRKAKPVTVAFERDLTPADIALLRDAQDGHLNAITPPLKKLRQRHHTLARILASGVKDAEASLITGYQASSISILKKDPGFQDLLAYYEGQKDEIFLDFHARLKELGLSCFQEIMDRLEDDPEQFSLEDLREFLVVASDRIGAGPSKSVAHSGMIGVVTSEHLLKIKDEVTKRQNGTVAQLDAKNNRTEVGRPLIQKSLAEEAQILEPSEEGTGV